jgi:hypothetical protein
VSTALQPLPYFQNAVIEQRKLLDYVLNPVHPVGGHKTRVFAAALGFTQSNSDDLEAEIRRALATHPAHERPLKPWGREFTVDVLLSGPLGRAIVRTGWMLDNDSEVPRMTTAFVHR